MSSENTDVGHFLAIRNKLPNQQMSGKQTSILSCSPCCFRFKTKNTSKDEDIDGTDHDSPSSEEIERDSDSFEDHPIDKDVKLKRLNEDSMARSLKKMEYAVRGKVLIAAEQIDKDLKSGKGDKYTFDNIVYTNIGNPHSVGQLPLTWPRQVLALTELPDEVGIAHPRVKNIFPVDAIERATIIKKALGGHGTGAYTHSQGSPLFREEVCRFIESRDDIPHGTCKKDDIFLTNGASTGIQMILTALIANKNW